MHFRSLHVGVATGATTRTAAPPPPAPPAAAAPVAAATGPPTCRAAETLTVLPCIVCDRPTPAVPFASIPPAAALPLDVTLLYPPEMEPRAGTLATLLPALLSDDRAGDVATAPPLIPNPLKEDGIDIG